MAHYSTYSGIAAPGVAETPAGTTGLPIPFVQAGELPPPGLPCTISGVINVTSPASAITVTVRCRQGAGAGGALVEQAQVTNLPASTQQEISFEFVDLTGLPVGPALYTVTAQLSVTGGSINSIEIDVNEGTGLL